MRPNQNKEACLSFLHGVSAPFPGEQFVDLRVRVIGYAADDVAKPGLGVDVVQASGLDERVYDSGAPSAFV